MKVSRTILALAVAGAGFAAAPASAQFFMSPRDMRDQPVKGDEPGIGVPMPGATDAELRASLVWNLRAALNNAALGCQFEPMLMSILYYNAVLRDHKDELAKSYDTLGKYFLRITKTKKEGQTALDSYSTRIYSNFSTAAAKYIFCQTAASVSRDAVFAPRGTLGDVASNHMRELHNALVPWAEQRFPRGAGFNGQVMVPRFDKICWDKNGFWKDNKCGPYQLSYR